MKKRIIPAVLIVAVLVVAGVLWSKRNDAANQNTIRLSGNLELTQVDMSFKVPGKLVDRTVTEGDAVKKGQLVARLDPQAATEQRARDVAATHSAESAVAQLHTSIAYQRAT